MLRLYVAQDGMPQKQLELPMPPDKIEAICSEPPEDKPFKILNADSPLPGLGWHLHYTAINNNAVLAKLNQLAKVIDGMNTAGLYHLARDLSTDYALSLDQIMGKVIDIPTSDLSGYELIPDTATDKELGNWLVEHGRFEVPNHLRPYLDYESVGREYRLEHDGVFLKDGYAGVQADVIKQEENIFQLKLATSQSSLILCLPVSDERLEKAKAVLDVEDFAQANIIDAQCSIFYLEMVLPLDNVTVEDANTLAQCVLEMAKENDCIMKYCAAMQVESPSTFSEAVSIAMDRDDYELIPYDMDEYGKQVLRRTGADDEIIDTIDGYMNFTQLGEDSMAEDGVRQTDFGMVRRISTPFPAENMGQTMG